MPEGGDLPRQSTLTKPQISIHSPIAESHMRPEAKEREGLRVNFTINNKHLITHTLSSMGENRSHSTEHQGDIVALQNHAWELSQPSYDFVVGRIQPEQFFAQGHTLEEVSDFLGKVEQSDEFGKIRQQTEESLRVVQEQWDHNYPQTAHMIEGLTGLDLNKEITVLMTHPDLNNGMYLGNNTLGWSHREDWPNYSTVYLWHEIMHSYFDYSNLSHALIQFITDNELRTRLNPSETYPPFVGHEDLIPLMERVMPYWQTYLQGITDAGKRDIGAFQARLKAMPEFQETEEQPSSQVIEG